MPPRSRLKVVIVDPMPVVRAGLKLLIDDRPDMEVYADTGNPDEAMELIAASRTSRLVILVGMGLVGDRDAFWLIRALRERHPSHVVIGLGGNAAPVTISRTLFTGADGFVDKGIDPDEFLAAIRNAAAGRMVLSVPSSMAVGDVATELERRRHIEGQLTEREREILVIAAEGLTAREIAIRLGIRERTVTTHLGRVYGKLGVGNRLAAIREAARSGLVAAPVVE
jgi:DNA-binding NarL/FixJ family response regulator